MTEDHHKDQAAGGTTSVLFEGSARPRHRLPDYIWLPSSVPPRRRDVKMGEMMSPRKLMVGPIIAAWKPWKAFL